MITVRLTDQGKREYENLLRRFGKSWHSSKSESFRELVHRLSEAMPFETRFDNPGFDTLDDGAEAEEQEHAEGPDPEVVCGEPPEE